MEELVEFLGTLNIFFLVFNLSLFFVRRIYKYFITEKQSKIAKLILFIMKILKKYHKISGILLIVVGITHGYLALNGNLYLHTGLILWIGIIFMFLIYTLGKINIFKNTWIKWHRYIGMFLIILLIIHLVDPWLL
ncbi:hypothetical protein X275_10225 [Marinitoga sp. 1197]|uniref:hypothetical protein n=1 Tax=Marinitoga sp. 1197 TaxID=1428449 RepID=UPI000641227C|nr:hypothetical protein [Marinitoga sp. 1197]KLO20998.1 hypothetical protein X275_10225 [Marinitoga sp. 1197]